MAKKSVKRKVGKKCPHCGKMVGPRSLKCKWCKGTIKPKTTAAKKPKRVQRQPHSEILEQIASIRKAGGLAEVKKAITAAENIGKILDGLGGLDGAKSVVKLVEEVEEALKAK